MTTSIEWTEATWNPTTGCDRVSVGCDNCYAMTMAKRLKGMGSTKYQNDGDPKTSGPGFGITEHPSALDLPMRWRKPRKVFVNSMSDLFHAGVSDDFIARVFATMALAPQHTYQILTKRHARMRSLLSSPSFEESVRLKVRHYDATEVYHREVANWPLPNVWLGVSVEDQKRADLRVVPLLETPAAVRFLSCEPLLGPIDLGWCDGVSVVRKDWIGTPGGSGTGAPHPLIDWVIVGGESGPDARPMDLDWVRAIRDECDGESTAFLFKQHGGRTPKANGRELDGRTWDEYPPDRSPCTGQEETRRDPSR